MYDTLIVGGGVAGLAVAGELARRGERVLLLDKWGIWGGRVWTERTHGLTYESGAGRIFNTHHRVNALVARYGLKTFPITADSDWEDRSPNPFNDLFEPLRAALSTLSAKDLAMHTIAELLPKSLLPTLDLFPYRSEFFLLRADQALKFFTPRATMGAEGPAFYGVVGGLDQIPKGLAHDAQKAGAVLRHNTTVTDVKRLAEDLFEIQATTNDTTHTYQARHVVLATCRCSLSDFKILAGHPILKQTGTGALTRIYAVYPRDPEGHVWYEGLPKVVTRNPLRYVIPIDPKKGLIMISYTDGADTEHWKGLKGEALQKEIQRCAQELFPDRAIPEPTYLKQHRWGGGCTYWLPGDYVVKDAIKAAMNPSANLYIVGESIAEEQCWIESALHSAETLLRLLK